MNGSWETLTFGQDGETVGKVSDIVLMRYILGFNWGVSSEWLSWIGSGNSVSGSAFIKGIENSVDDTRVGTECSSHTDVKNGLVVRSDGFAQHFCS
jgi:hypothetical protein